MTDFELLADYAQRRSQEAFTTLVERYVRLVHSACQRQLGDAQLAEDATQMVFMLLSQKAAKLKHAELAGWLLTTAHYTCANMKRSEQRRQIRERKVAMQETSSNADSNSDLLSMLDTALLRLQTTDRTAIVRRFLQEEPLLQVGQTLGLSEDAARKRVERALEKLRQFFRDRGIQTDSIALAAVLADHSHTAVAESLVHRIVQAACAPSVAAAPILHGKMAIAASVAISTMLGVAAWGIFRSPSGHSVATPIQLVSSAIPTSTATSPATNTSAPDRSTPDSTLASLCRALQAADRTAVYACLVSDSISSKKSFTADMEWDLANRRMQLTAEQTYGPGQSINTGYTSLEQCLVPIVALRQLQGDTPTIRTDSAIIDISIPPAIMRSMPTGMQETFRHWIGKPLYFQLQNGAWQIDLARSVRIIVWYWKNRTDGRGTLADDTLAATFFKQQASNCDALTAEMVIGQLSTIADAEQLANTKFKESLAKLGFIGGISTDVYPADFRFPGEHPK